jgi:WhiB family transcriptional regulator, redox-sensing transcriptional regulator
MNSIVITRKLAALHRNERPAEAARERLAPARRNHEPDEGPSRRRLSVAPAPPTRLDGPAQRDAGRELAPPRPNQLTARPPDRRAESPPVTELTIRARRTPAADRFDADAAARQGLADGDDPMARLHQDRHGGSPRRSRQTRHRVAPKLPCQRHDPELWFADAPTDIEQAKTLCVACPVRLTCLAAAIDGQEFAGVWGGQLLDRGRIVPHKRPRGRPRKHHLTPGRCPLNHDEAVPTRQTSSPRDTPQDRLHAAVRRLRDAESRVYAAHRSHVEEWIIAANKKLRDAAAEYLAATAAQNPAA